MEKLTLKEIAGYLPYDLKCDLGYMQVNVTLEDEMDGESICVLDLIENKHKILLYPLEMLTKPIVHNGFEIIPIEYFEIGDDSDSYPYEFDNGNIKLIKQLELISKHNFYHDIKFLPYEVVQQLQAWHFDIFGLIKLRKAIDKSTLNSK